MTFEELREQSEHLYVNISGGVFRLRWMAVVDEGSDIAEVYHVDYSTELRTGIGCVLRMLGEWAKRVATKWGWDVAAILTRFCRESLSAYALLNKDAA